MRLPWYEAKKLEKHAPDVTGIMLSKLRRNCDGLTAFLQCCKGKKRAKSRVYDFNSSDGIPARTIRPESIDLIVTSPPYGDSGTTVAYGQYSRLSSAWLNFHEPHRVDRNLMGGRVYKEDSELPSETLSDAISQVAKEDEKRARQVRAFYIDLLNSMQNVAKTLRRGGHACYVVGNRKVKGVVLPTDIAIRDFFETAGLSYVDTFIRSIPNKRMPVKNSPSNKPGVLDVTMSNEYIVVMEKP